MPKTKWTQSELEKVVPLRYEGHSWTEIARLLTTDNLRGLMLEDSVFQSLDAVNQKRKRSTPMRDVLGGMLEVSPPTSRSWLELRLDSVIVLPPRLQHMGETDRFKTYYDAYAARQEQAWKYGESDE